VEEKEEEEEEEEEEKKVLGGEFEVLFGAGSTSIVPHVIDRTITYFTTQ
jgi:hypothetical protein